MRETQKRRTTAGGAREGPYRGTAKRPRAKRKRRKLTRAGRMLVFICILLALVCISGAAIWLLLPVGAVTISGKTPYQQEKVLQVSGIAVGDRLFGVNKRKTTRLLETNLPYISSASVSWRLPNTLILRLNKDTPIAAVPRAGGFAVLDAQGKVLEIPANLQALPNLPTVTGPDTGASAPGQTLNNAEKAKLTAAVSLLQAIKAAGIAQVTSVDVHDAYQITFGYQNRITVLVGTSADFDEKLKFASYMLTQQLLATDKGTLDVSHAAQSNQAVFSPAS
ncbi:MAG: FtsQ-type POTRA domain-containing protein [Ethanoligenens sp.]